MKELAEQLIHSMTQTNKKKLELVEELISLSKKQEMALSSGSYNTLLDHIRLKQEHMDQIDALDRSFYNDFVQLKSVLNVGTMEEINKDEFPSILYLKTVVASILEKLSTLKELDNKNNGGVREEIEKVKNEMKSLSHQVKATRVYSDGYRSESPGFFVDSKK